MFGNLNFDKSVRNLKTQVPRERGAKHFIQRFIIISEFITGMILVRV